MTEYTAKSQWVNLAERWWVNLGERYRNRYIDLENIQNTPTKTTSELYSFRLHDIILACQKIYKIYGNGSLKQTESKRQLLITRTKQIVMRLWEMKKLDFSTRPNHRPLFDQYMQKAGSERIGQMAVDTCSDSSQSLAM